MALLKLIEAPHPVLKQRAQDVPAVSEPIRTLMDNMLSLMYQAEGIGLAAPQVGISQRIIVMDMNAGHEDNAALTPLQMVNPEIVWASPETSSCKEGCLSLPGCEVEIVRPATIKVHYIDKQNTPVVLEATGLLATCIQHEIDHLNGVLMIDYLSSLKKEIMLRRIKRIQKSR
jgi:peptide deformylase